MQFISTIQSLANHLFPELPKGAENINHCAFASCLSENWYEQLESKEDFESCPGAQQGNFEHLN